MPSDRGATLCHMETNGEYPARLNLRLSEEQRELIERDAAANGNSLSDTARDLLVAAMGAEQAQERADAAVARQADRLALELHEQEQTSA